jgi:short-subunit dehydrogenase
MSQTAVITGATSGIGAAYARRLAADGYDLIITGRRKEIIQKLADDIAAQHKVKVKLIIAELSVDSDIQKVIDAIKTDGNVAMLINNAGYAGDLKPLMDMKLADCEQMVKVHQVATLRLIYAVVPDMVKRGKGAIINLSSIAAYMPMPGGTLYGGSKAFLKMFSEALHMDLKDKGIKVQALCPGFIPSDFYRGFTED